MKNALSVFFSLLFNILCFTQNIESSFTPLSIEGVPFHKKTNCVFEDRLGFLWIGTNNGLYKYYGQGVDKYEYNVFDERSLPNNNINSIVEDDFGNLWLGSESYLISYNRANNSFKGYYRDKTSKVLGKSMDGTIWSFLPKTGLIKITPHETTETSILDTKFNYKDREKVFGSIGQINQYLEDHYKRHWFATSKGIMALDSSLTKKSTGFNKNTIALYKGNNNFIAATNRAIYVLGYHENDYELDIQESYNTGNFPQNETLNTRINSLTVEDQGHTIWIGTDNGLIKGTRTKNSYNFDLYETQTDITNQINTTLIDKFDNLWIGSQRGVSKLISKSSIFEYHSFSVAFQNTFASSILIENKAQLLVSFNGRGLHRYHLKTKSHEPYLRTTNDIGAITFDYYKKELLIGYDRQLVRTKNYTVNGSYPMLDTLKTYSKSVRDIIAVNDSEIWVGLWGGGIDVINTKAEISRFAKHAISSLSNDNVFVMHLDQHHNIWVGTRGNGLFRINLVEEKIKHYVPEQQGGLSSNAILSLKESKDGDIWIGTRGGGLNLYNRKNDSFQTFGKSEGLLSLTISGIEEDRNGNLWINSDESISFFDTRIQEVKNFGVDEGIKGVQFSFNSHNVLDNNVYFGTLGGFYNINTVRFNKTTLIPNTVITDFSIFGDEANNKLIYDNNQNLKNKLSKNERINLSHTENNIVFKFSSLDFTSPSKNKYAYMLEGVNNFWVYTDASNRNANYNNLPPGNYTFKVKSSNSDGVWNEDPAVLVFSISPPFWKSNLAIGLYWLLALITLYVTFYLMRKWYRLKKNLVAETVSRHKDNEYHNMRMVFFTDISHELRTPLTLIKGAIEKVVREKNYTMSSLTAQRIHNNTIRINRLINQIMDIRKYDVGKFKLKVSKNNIIDDIKKIKNAFNDLAEINHIDYTFKCDKSTLKAWYDYQILEKILFNLLSNAFKYTPTGGSIDLLVESMVKEDAFDKTGTTEYIVCQVIDTGSGIDKKDIPFIFNRFYQTEDIPKHQVSGTGVGMELVQKLVKLHKGFINVESEKNKLTKFTFYFPIKKKNYLPNEIGTSNEVQDSSLLSQLKDYHYSNNITAEEAIPGNKAKSKPSILIVEDNLELLNMMEEELAEDFNVLKAGNGKAGYEKIISDKPQLVLSDISMPEEDGVEMLKRVKMNPEISHIPIFMLTARGSDDIKIKCLRIGADDFIEKPFSIEFVKWKVKNTLFKQRNLKEKYSRVISAEPSEVELESNSEKLIRKLVQIIENHIDDDLLSVEFLASEVGMSRASLYRKLLSITDETPVEFIKKIRLKRATQLLKKDDLYVSEIAHMTGFNNLKYFSKCFKKEYGLTPTQYADQASLI